MANDAPNTIAIDIYSAFSNILNCLPYGLYSATILEAIFFSDLRGLLLFLGCLFNELIILIISFFGDSSKVADRNKHCAIFKNGKLSLSSNFGAPSAYMQRVAFFAGFILTYSIYHQKYNPLSIACVIFILLGLSLNLVTQGCSNIVEIVGGIVLGMIIGFGYFMMIRKIYKEKQTYTSDDDFICETVEVEA